MKLDFAKKALLLTAFSLVSSFVFAEGIQISPVTLDISPKQPISTLSLKNLNATPVSYQITQKNWTQPKGKDVLTDSQTLIITPPIFTIAPGKTQIIRVASQTLVANPAPLQAEQAYRIVLKELPTDVPQKKDGLTFLTDFSIPVFVAPTENAKDNLTWHLIPKSDGTTEVQVTNNGNLHARISHLAVKVPKGAMLGQDSILTYVFPGETHTWEINTKGKNTAAAMAKGKEVRLVAVTNNGTIKENFALS